MTESTDHLPSFSIQLSHKGKVILLDSITNVTSGSALDRQVREGFGWQPHDEVKLLYKGKKIMNSEQPAFPKHDSSNSKKIPKVMVMATTAATVTHFSHKKSDPLLRGFEDESRRQSKLQNPSIWGPQATQDKNFKFVRFEACTWQSFGHRSSEKTPHAFAAMRLLEQLATDPGIIAIMKERELVVNTLGEMDPIDDRLMQKTQQHGASCLLGYNTNHGLRIDIKLRTEDLQGFRSYAELVKTLIHELSHNWVGDHNLLFWTNYAQMRAEYLYHHMHNTKNLVQGKTTAELAGLGGRLTKESILPSIHSELAKDMAQHRLHPNMIAEPVQQRCQELDTIYSTNLVHTQRIGGGSTGDSNGGALSVREKALAAAERRRQEQSQDKKQP